MKRDIEDLISTSHEIYATAFILHLPIVRIRYYIETVFQKFETYTVARIRCYIGIIFGIVTDSY